MGDFLSEKVCYVNVCMFVCVKYGKGQNGKIGSLISIKREIASSRIVLLSLSLYSGSMTSHSQVCED